MANSIWARLSISAQPSDKQSPEERVNNWEEVYRGLDLQRARLEAARCIHCPTTPCIEACPAHNDIPGALLLLEGGDPIGAANRFRETSNLPEMCGRLCPHERLCEGDCPVGFAIRPDGRKEPPVGIGVLEAFVADTQRAQLGGFPLPADLPEPSGRRVAVVGSGPSGLTVAEELVKRGHEVTVFDQWPSPGGALAHGIPNFKLAKRILSEKLRFLTMLGADFVSGVRVGRDVSVDELLDEGFDAVYLATGAGVDRELRIPGAAEYEGVSTATEFLLRANAASGRLLASGNGAAPMALVRQEEAPAVVVIGGTDAAMDSVRTALRMGASSVTLACSGTREELAARAEEETDARAEGVLFRFETEPVAFTGDAEGRLTGVRLRRLERGEVDDGGRLRRFAVPGSDFEIPARLAVIAIGYEPDPLLREATEGLNTNGNGYLHTESADGHTSRRGVFAGGDVVHGEGLVVTAMTAGRRAAAAIDAYLRELELQPSAPSSLPPVAGSAPRNRWFRRARSNGGSA
ncbi:MAG TPA: FAD-dependent oxidoreductase [Dehalococcoidia bacterium]|nr:FAD-dependent oxidoreductase [Dehalococcoidia bacterium]